MRVTWSLQHERLDDFEPTIRSLYEIAFSTEKAARTIIFSSEKAFVKSCHKDWSEAQEKIATEVIKLYELKKEIDNEFKERKKFHGHNDAENKEHFKLICAIENRVKVLRRLADTIAQRVFDNKMWMAKRFLLNKKLQKPDIEAIKDNLQAANFLNKQSDKDFWLIADLTTYIGVGDLIHRKYLGEGKFKWNIIELKVGKVNKLLFEMVESEDFEKEEIITKLDANAIEQIERLKKQKNRRQEILNFINKGEGIDIRTGINLKLDPKEVNHARYDKEFIDIIDGAKKSQVAFAIIDGCLALFASTLNDEDTFHFLYHIVFEDKKMTDNGKCMQNNDERFIMERMLLHPYVKDILLHNLNAAPHTSFFSLPLENLLYDLLFGRIRIIVYLNINAFCALCTYYHITVELLSKKETHLINSIDTIPMINKKGIKLTYPNGEGFVLGKGSLCKMYYDLVRPTSLIESLMTKSSMPS